MLQALISYVFDFLSSLFVHITNYLTELVTTVVAPYLLKYGKQFLHLFYEELGINDLGFQGAC